MIGLDHYLILSVMLFCIGIFGVLVRKNLLVILMSVEIMLSAANIAFVAFSHFNGQLDGQVFVLFAFIVAACEVGVGLGILVAAFRHKATVEVTEWRLLKG